MMHSRTRYLTLPALALAAVALLAGLSIVAGAQCAQAAGFTRTYEQSTVGGTFVPPQTHVAETFYNYPGIGPTGPYPGSGFAAEYGLGFTPYGYQPFGSFSYL